MKASTFILPFLLLCTPVLQANEVSLPFLRISQEGTHIETTEGKPLFWMADSAWDLLQQLDEHEAIWYFKNRAQKGFNTVHIHATATTSEGFAPNPRGDLPLINNDPGLPNPLYFEWLDKMIAIASAEGLYLALTPVWNAENQAQQPNPIEDFTPTNTRAFGSFLAQRYLRFPVIWLLDGSNPTVKPDSPAIMEALALGIREVAGTSHLISVIPPVAQSSSGQYHPALWLDFNIIRSGQITRGFPNHHLIVQDLSKTPPKPVLEGESCHEDHPIRFNPANGLFDDFDTRRAAWWALLSGASGYTYGHHGVARMWEPGKPNLRDSARTPWHQAIDYPGAFQMGILLRFLESIPWTSIEAAQEILAQDNPDAQGLDVVAARCGSSGPILIYTPHGSRLTLTFDRGIGRRILARWFNPRDGNFIQLGEGPLESTMHFDPPHGEKPGNDWLLVLD